MPDPSDPLKFYLQLISIISAVITITTVVVTRALPWVKAKLDSRSIRKRIGAELYPVGIIERALRYYVQPFCQDVDPTGGEDLRLVYGVKQKLFEVLDDVLYHSTEYRYLILLADSGMGKTTAMLNYYVRHIRRWWKKNKIVLIPLGIPDADKRITDIAEKQNTILFLDALDEDTLAVIDHAERIRLLLELTREFERVVISCRTQFFSKEEEIPKGTAILKIGVRDARESAEYFFHKVYIAPFSDKQVAKYLKQRYPIWRWQNRRRAKEVVKQIPDLAIRPMLLAHIDYLINAKREIRYTYEVYEEMVEAWLERERGFVQEKEDLRQFSELLAVDLYLKRTLRGAERIPKAELSDLAQQWHIQLDSWKLSGRSLLNRDAEGNYKFAHRSIMEYLFVKRFFDGDLRCLKCEWTDQMQKFLREMLENDIAQNGVLPFHNKESKLYKAPLTSESIELLRSVAERDLSSIDTVMAILAVILDPSGRRNVQTVLMKSTGALLRTTLDDQSMVRGAFHVVSSYPTNQAIPGERDLLIPLESFFRNDTHVGLNEVIGRTLATMRYLQDNCTSFLLVPVKRHETAVGLFVGKSPYKDAFSYTQLDALTKLMTAASMNFDKYSVRKSE